MRRATPLFSSHAVSIARHGTQPSRLYRKATCPDGYAGEAASNSVAKNICVQGSLDTSCPAPDDTGILAAMDNGLDVMIPSRRLLPVLHLVIAIVACSLMPFASTAQQDAEKIAFLTRPTPARRDAPFTKRRSRVAQRLNVPKRTPRPFARCGLAGRPF